MDEFTWSWTRFFKFVARWVALYLAWGCTGYDHPVMRIVTLAIAYFLYKYYLPYYYLYHVFLAKPCFYEF